MHVLRIIGDFIVSIDLREIIYAAIGAFLGFWSAIILDNKSKKKSEAELINTSLKNLRIELEDIYNALQDASVGQNIVIYTPIYDASVNSGNILVFVEKGYYIDLLKTYSMIKILAQAEFDTSSFYGKTTNQFASFGSNTINDRNNIRNDVKICIEKLFEKIDKENNK